MKHHYFKGVILKACLLRNTESIVINCSSTSSFAFWTWLIFLHLHLADAFIQSDLQSFNAIFLKLFIFCIIQQRQEIQFCIVCGVGHDTLKSN